MTLVPAYVQLNEKNAETDVNDIEVSPVQAVKLINGKSHPNGRFHSDVWTNYGNLWPNPNPNLTGKNWYLKPSPNINPVARACEKFMCTD